MVDLPTPCAPSTPTTVNSVESPSSGATSSTVSSKASLSSLRGPRELLEEGPAAPDEALGVAAAPPAGGTPACRVDAPPEAAAGVRSSTLCVAIFAIVGVDSRAGRAAARRAPLGRGAERSPPSAPPIAPYVTRRHLFLKPVSALRAIDRFVKARRKRRPRPSRALPAAVSVAAPGSHRSADDTFTALSSTWSRPNKSILVPRPIDCLARCLALGPGRPANKLLTSYQIPQHRPRALGLSYNVPTCRALSLYPRALQYWRVASPKDVLQRDLFAFGRERIVSVARAARLQ